MCLVFFAWATRQDFFKNLTDLDVRLEMYKNEIEKIESEIMPFGFFDDGTPETQKSEKIGEDYWILSDKPLKKVEFDTPIDMKLWF
jgi:hypothetical protein